MSGKRQQAPNQRLCGVTVKNKDKYSSLAKRTMSKYYYCRDHQTFEECLLELLAIIATSYEDVDEELSFLRQAVLGEDRNQTRL